MVSPNLLILQKGCMHIDPRRNVVVTSKGTKYNPWMPISKIHWDLKAKEIITNKTEKQTSIEWDLLIREPSTNETLTIINDIFLK